MNLHLWVGDSLGTDLCLSSELRLGSAFPPSRPTACAVGSAFPPSRPTACAVGSADAPSGPTACGKDMTMLPSDGYALRPKVLRRRLRLSSEPSDRLRLGSADAPSGPTACGKDMTCSRRTATR
jgi:hypothetical protein